MEVSVTQVGRYISSLYSVQQGISSSKEGLARCRNNRFDLPHGYWSKTGSCRCWDG
jgi:hypothetical protein